MEDVSAPSRDGPLGFGNPASNEGGVVAAQVQRAGEGFLVHHQQSTADLMCVCEEARRANDNNTGCSDI